MDTEKLAAEVLLDKGVAWRLPAPWFLRIFGKSTVRLSIKPLRLGTLLELSRLYLAMGITEEKLSGDVNQLIRSNVTMVSRIAAICILNSRIRIRLFTGILARFLQNRLTGNAMLELMMFVVTLSGASAFLSTIRLIGVMKMTSPRNLGPEDQGSQQS